MFTHLFVGLCQTKTAILIQRDCGFYFFIDKYSCLWYNEINKHGNVVQFIITKGEVL